MALSNEDIKAISDLLQPIKDDLQEVKQRMSNVENKVTNIELTLENEISVNIKRVAEGHLDLSRNLHEALKIDSEKEMMAVRVNILESELRRIKQRLNDIA
jgi:archaellum component FlaC